MQTWHYQQFMLVTDPNNVPKRQRGIISKTSELFARFSYAIFNISELHLIP